MIYRKNVHEQKLMRKSGKILADVFEQLKQYVKVGVSTKEIDLKAYELIKKQKCKPAFLGYNGFPATICASINDEVVHGIPSEKRILKNGDIFSVDIGLVKDEYFADMAYTFAMGKISKADQKLIDITLIALEDGIKCCRVGNRLGDIGSAIQRRVEKKGLSVVREYVGHGIGKSMHEEPQILNYGFPGTGPEIKEGMVFALEPMVNLGGWKTRVLKDDWTVVTKDGSKSAHFEHTVLVTENGPKVLTTLDS